MKFLDEPALQQQRLRFAPHHMDVEIVDGFDERLELQVPAKPPRWMEILAHALAQVARLADVDHRAEAVLHQVHARLVRQLAQFFADRLGRRHGRNMADGRRLDDREFTTQRVRCPVRGDGQPLARGLLAGFSSSDFTNR